MGTLRRAVASAITLLCAADAAYLARTTVDSNGGSHIR